MKQLSEYEYSKDSYQTHIQNLPRKVTSGAVISCIAGPKQSAGNDPTNGEKRRLACLQLVLMSFQPDLSVHGELMGSN